ncbi:MAG: molybdopterin molybdenumtransferase MoeA [Planctomycetota bacterium]|nr:MAG: molybdopterin molybdenumtransferase MoeA [Planctomycetota bacterium]
MLEPAAALKELVGAFAPLGAERVELSAALGRVLADPVHAREDSPPFDNSAMDGYAVRSAELAGASPETPVRLPLRGESRAGGPPPPPLPPGHAQRIFTGAPLPEGADAVLMQEDSRRPAPDVVEALASVPPGRHVRRRGEDVARGDRLLAAGALVGPGEVGLLAAQRQATVSVHRRPQVALLSTGDELRDLSDPPEPGTIVNSNAYALAAQVRVAGGIPWVLPTAPDEPTAIEAAVREGLRADLLLTLGGVSVGEYDFVRGALAACGVRERFWKVAVKPGKPISFGLAGTTPVVGLPGNPVSAMVTFEVFVRPGLRRLQGDPRPYRPRVEVALASDHRRRAGRLELARARLEAGGHPPRAHLLARQGSGSLPSMVGVDALVLLPPEREEFVAGERLPALLLEGRCDRPPFSVGP